MCAKGNGANFSPTLLMEEWDANVNMEVVSTPPNYVMGERRETPHARAHHASPRRAGHGLGGAKGAGAQHLREWSAEIQPLV
jgi:hypothetical protein